MTQELNLIDTIFYFVDTMAEYRLMLLENKVLSRTIVFVDETLEIYKDGKLFGAYKELVGRIDLLAQEVRDAMDQSENEVRELMRQLREGIWSSFEEEVQLITTNLLTYETRLADLRAQFEAGEVLEAAAYRDLDELKGLLIEYASWKTSVDQTLTTFSRIVDAQNATIRTFGERLDVAEDKVTNYEHLIDLKEQSLKEYIESYDINNKVRDIIGREILLQDGLLHDYATRTDVDDMVRTSVDTWYNSLEPSWTQLTSLALLGKEAYDRITVMGGIDNRIEQLGNDVTSIRSTVTIFSDWYDNNKEFIAYLKTTADGNEASFDLQAALNKNDGNNDLVKLISARIFGYVNGTTGESTLALQANHINFQGYTMTVDVNLVEGLGDWILGNVTVNKFKASDGANRSITINALPTSEPDGVYGIKSSTNGFYFKMDGSGWVANKNIEWDAAGNLKIKGTEINPNANGETSTTVFENVYISNYWSKTEFLPTNYATKALVTELGNIIGNLSDSSNSTLKDWVLNKIAEAALPEGLNLVIEQLVLSYLNNEIQRADGPFSNFITSAELPGEINSALNTALANYVTGTELGTTLDGYVTSEGLGTDVRGLIYDEDTGELIADGPLYSSFAALETMSAALVADDPVTGEPTFVIGTIATQAINSKVENYITNDSALSTIRTWASTIDSNTDAGFVLESLVKKIKGDDSTVTNDTLIRAYISGVVSDEVGSSITISADLINLDGLTLFETLSGEFSYTFPIYGENSTENVSMSGSVYFNPEYLEFIKGRQKGGISASGMYIITDNSITSIGTNGITVEYNNDTVSELYNGKLALTEKIVLDTEGHQYYLNLTSIFYADSDYVKIGVPTEITDSVSITDNLTLTGNTSKITTPTLWVKGALSGNDPGAQFDANVVFNDEADFSSTVQISGDLDLLGDLNANVNISAGRLIYIDSGVDIYVGGDSTYTGSISISGKRLLVRKGLIYGVMTD